MTLGMMQFALRNRYVLHWRRTGDRLFAAFAVAFWLLAIHKALISFPALVKENQIWAFLPSLAAFALLILAILVKNFDGWRMERE